VISCKSPLPSLLNIDHRIPGDERHPIGGPQMAQYLLAMLSQRAGREGPGGPFGGFNVLGAPEDGRWGDYVFNQEGRKSRTIVMRNELTCVALDQIITQIMEQGNSSRPVPATEDVVQKLQREVLEEGCESTSRYLSVNVLNIFSCVVGARLCSL
jgi:E3 ubiquitin-protein ligase RNF115/126